MKKQVIILAFDALEYDIIEELDLTNIKQIEYGKINLLLDRDEPPLTPIIWCSFITGKTSEILGLKYQPLNSAILERIARSKFFKFVNYRWREIIVSVLKIFGVKRKKLSKKSPWEFTKEDINYETIFDFLEDTLAVSVPSYNPDSFFKELRVLAITGSKSILKERAWAEFEERKKCLFKAITENRSLIMVHFFSLDVIQHKLFYDKKYIKSSYMKFDKLTKEVKEKVKNNALILVISDHGQNNGLHTRYGFYSSNENMNLNYPRITDFVNIIRKKLDVPSEGEMKIIENRLRKLGYME